MHAVLPGNDDRLAVLGDRTEQKLAFVIAVAVVLVTPLAQVGIVETGEGASQFEIGVRIKITIRLVRRHDRDAVHRSGALQAEELVHHVGLVEPCRIGVVLQFIQGRRQYPDVLGTVEVAEPERFTPVGGHRIVAVFT